MKINDKIKTRQMNFTAENVIFQSKSKAESIYLPVKDFPLPNKIMKDKALELIEDIASELAYTEDMKTLKEKIGDIYAIAHVANGHCGNKHSDWVEKYGLGVHYDEISE